VGEHDKQDGKRVTVAVLIEYDVEGLASAEAVGQMAAAVIVV
jgi:hypothetical protein